MKLERLPLEPSWLAIPEQMQGCFPYKADHLVHFLDGAEQTLSADLGFLILEHAPSFLPAPGSRHCPVEVVGAAPPARL